MWKRDIELVTFSAKKQSKTYNNNNYHLETDLSAHVFSTSDPDVFSGIQSCLFSTEDVEKKFRGKIKSNRSLPNIPTHYCVDTERAESAAMNLNKGGGHVPTFVSHVSRAEDEEDGFHDAETQPRLLEGEYEVVRVSHVCLYTANSSGLTSGHTGDLYVTTLKVSFEHYLSGGEARTNKLVADTDIPLSWIETVYELHGDNADKKRKLVMGSSRSTANNKVDGIFILCKNFKIYKFKFNLQSSKVDAGRNIANAILHHARPASAELLFGYENNLSALTGTSDQRGSLWERVIKQSQCPNIRVSRANSTWQVSASLPRQFCVPGHVTDDMVTRMAVTCTGRRPPVWLWGTRSGGSLFIQPDFDIEESHALDDMKRDYFRSYNMCVLENLESLPKLSQLEESFSSMLELHCVDTDKEMRDKDDNYFSSLESCGWLATIGSALQTASYLAESLSKGMTVVVKHDDGRSYSILLASLAMILLTDEFRTREGFEQVVLRNWVSLGYPFSLHHTLTISPAGAALCPVFLLFLDCVHQLAAQFPAHFAFSSAYLARVWDTVLLPLTHTFMFDCEKDREAASNARSAPLSFDWSLQFSQEQIAAWDNPLYKVPMRPRRLDSIAKDISPNSMVTDRRQSPLLPDTKKVLPVSWDIFNLHVWHELFSRNVPSLQKDSMWESKLTEVQREAKICITNQGNGMIRRNNHK